MRFTFKTALVWAIAAAAMTWGSALAAPDAVKGMAAVYPFAFARGTKTARSSVYDAAEGIARKAGYASVPHHVAAVAWADLRLRSARLGHMPRVSALRKFAKRVKA